ncbi:MAG: hypothetical protein KDJ42_08385 [Alphaproteobacteria bacterium]|nr:hypothetical protein [Alphaproteobacteria bacterium]
MFRPVPPVPEELAMDSGLPPHALFAENAQHVSQPSPSSSSSSPREMSFQEHQLRAGSGEQDGGGKYGNHYLQQGNNGNGPRGEEEKKKERENQQTYRRMMVAMGGSITMEQYNNLLEATDETIQELEAKQKELEVKIEESDKKIAVYEQKELTHEEKLEQLNSEMEERQEALKTESELQRALGNSGQKQHSGPLKELMERDKKEIERIEKERKATEEASKENSENLQEEKGNNRQLRQKHRHGENDVKHARQFREKIHELREKAENGTLTAKDVEDVPERALEKLRTKDPEFYQQIKDARQQSPAVENSERTASLTQDGQGVQSDKKLGNSFAAATQGQQPSADPAPDMDQTYRPSIPSGTGGMALHS